MKINSLQGKKIGVYDPKTTSSLEDISNYLNEFNRLSTLRTICELKSQFKINHIGGIPIVEEISNYCIICAIKYCKKNEGIFFTQNDFTKLYNKCYDVYFKEMIKDDPEPESLVVRLSYQQYPFQDRIFNALARSFIIYKELWYKVDIDNKVPIYDKFKEIVGCSFELALCMTYANLGNQHKYFWELNSEEIDTFKEAFNGVFNTEEYEKYLNWVSDEYAFYKKQHAVNPIILKPILKTNESPLPDRNCAYIILSYISLFNKLSKGVFYTISDYYQNGNENDFKGIYGKVFELYVGRIINYYLHKLSVRGEIEYKENGNPRHSCDFFLRKDNTLLLIEVKRPSLYAKSKTSGERKIIENDLNQTLIKAGKQLNETIRVIKENKVKEFSDYWDVDKFIGLIVCEDSLYNANPLFKKIMDSIITVEIPYNIINIDDLEVLLDAQSDSESLIEILEYKILNYKDWDFKEYVSEMYKDKTIGCEFLSNKHEYYVNEMCFNKGNKK